MSGSHNNFNDKKEDVIFADKGGINNSPLIKVRKRTGSSGSMPSIQKSKEKDDDVLVGSKKNSPRSPRRENSPRWEVKNSSPRLHALWYAGGRNSRSPSSSPRFDYKYNPLPISENEIEACINRANAFVLEQTKAAYKGMYFHIDAQGAGGAYMDANDSENKYAVIITRAAEKAGWKYYLIEKIHLLIDENKKTGPQEIDSQHSDSFVSKGNEGRVVYAWDLQPSDINGEIIREKIAAKIHHLKSYESAVLNEQLVLNQLGWLYGRFDYFYGENNAVEWLKGGAVKKATKKIIFMPLFPGKELMSVIYKLDMSKPETDARRYLGKNDHSILHKICIGGAYIKAARFLQAKGITHRDLKPNNALIDDNGVVHFIDFSSAKLTAKITGKESVAGTFPFLAPEFDKLNNKAEKNFNVSDNYTVGIALIEILTGKNFRPRIIEKDAADREAFHLKREEFSEIAPDLFYADVITDFAGRLQAFIHQDDVDLENNQIDSLLQELIYKSYGRSKLIKVIYSLTKAKPDERMSLDSAEMEWNKIERELTQTYEAFKSILQAKAYLHSKQLPAELINKTTDKMCDMQRSEKGRNKRRSYQQLALSSSSSDSERKSSPSSSSDSSPPSPFPRR